MSQSGLVTGIAAGTVVITATSEGTSGQASITISATAAPVATVSVTPATASIPAGSTQQLAANTFDANGGAFIGRTVTWSSSDVTKATVSTAGLVTGVAPGTATITATSEGRTGAAAITYHDAMYGTTNSIKLNPGDIRTISATDAAGLCLGGLTAATEYVLIPFNNSNVAASTTPFQLDATNTLSVRRCRTSV